MGFKIIFLKAQPFFHLNFPCEQKEICQVVQAEDPNRSISDACLKRVHIN